MFTPEASRSPTAGRKPRVSWTILSAGLVAGILDLTAACVTWGVRGVRPSRVLQGIASGLLGREAAFGGGAGAATLGFALHFLIATGAATAFYVASRMLPILTQRPFVSGALFGVAVYVFMDGVVLPLAGVRVAPHTLGSVALSVAVHVFCVGLPIALVVRRCAGTLQAARS